MRRFLLILFFINILIIPMVVSVLLEDPNIVGGIKNLDDSIEKYAYIDETKCFENGAIEVRIRYLKSGLTKLDNLVKGVGARRDGWNYTLDLKSYWYDKEGYWFDENYMKSASNIHSGDTGIFISDEFMLNEPGNYKLILSGVPMEIIHLTANAKYYEVNFTCPGYKHSCKINPKIDECYSDGKYFVAKISGLGFENFSKIKLNRDIEYKLNYENYLGSIHMMPKIPNSTEYKVVNQTIGMVRIPLRDLSEPIKYLKIHITGCNENFDLTDAYNTCGFKQVIDGQKVILKMPENEKTKINLSSSYNPDYKVEYPINLTLVKKTPLIEQTFSLFYELIPFEEGSLKNFLYELGKI